MKKPDVIYLIFHHSKSFQSEAPSKTLIFVSRIPNSFKNILIHNSSSNSPGNNDRALLDTDTTSATSTSSTLTSGQDKSAVSTLGWYVGDGQGDGGEGEGNKLAVPPNGWYSPDPSDKVKGPATTDNLQSQASAPASSTTQSESSGEEVVGEGEDKSAVSASSWTFGGGARRLRKA